MQSLGISRTSSLSERSEDGTEQPPQAVPKDIFYPKNIGQYLHICVLSIQYIIIIIIDLSASCVVAH